MPAKQTDFFNLEEIADQIILENESCVFIHNIGFVPEGVLEGSGMIIPKSIKETPFEFTEKEILDTFALLQEAKKYIDEKYQPDGYTIGWNIGAVGGQNVFHAHLHVLPRYEDEPLAGKGIRYAFKDETNKRKKYQK